MTEPGPRSRRVRVAFALAAVLAPVLAWISPLSLAALAGLCGLLALGPGVLQAMRSPLGLALAAFAAWAAASMAWSPYRPPDVEGLTAVKLVLQYVLYLGLVAAALRAAPVTARGALLVLAAAVFGVAMLLLVEAATQALPYRTLRQWVGDPIRPDLARRNVAQAAFILALLWPPLLASGGRAGALAALAAAAAAGALALAFDAQAPLLALLAGGLAYALVAWRPRAGAAALALGAAAYVLLAPAVVGAVVRSGLAEVLAARAPASWAQRLDYWGHAAARAAEKPIFGHGLDVSRALPGEIVLHPHNAALQVWLELGGVGAALAAIVLGLAFLHRCDGPAAPARAAFLAAYVAVGAVSFGAWQEWWLACAAMGAAFLALAARAPAR